METAQTLRDELLFQPASRPIAPHHVRGGSRNDHGRRDVGAAVHTPDGLRVTAIVAALIGAGVTFGALVLAIKLVSHLGRHPGDRYPLHGAHRGLDGNAIRIGRPLGSSVSLIDTDFG
jgi:hypothetical protein